MIFNCAAYLSMVNVLVAMINIHKWLLIILYEVPRRIIENNIINIPRANKKYAQFSLAGVVQDDRVY